MVTDKSVSDNHAPLSARALLEKFHYGHTEAVERILRFADENNLNKDDTVWLLASILKGNEELIRLLLQAIAHAEKTLASTRDKAAALQKFTQQLIGTIEGAADRAAGRLNVAADRFSGAIHTAEKLSGLLIHNSKDLQITRDALQRLLDLPEDTDVAGKLWMHVSHQAREYLHVHGHEVMQEMKIAAQQGNRIRHVYSVCNLALLVITILLLVGR